MVFGQNKAATDQYGRPFHSFHHATQATEVSMTMILLIVGVFLLGGMGGQLAYIAKERKRIRKLRQESAVRQLNCITIEQHAEEDWLLENQILELNTVKQAAQNEINALQLQLDENQASRTRMHEIALSARNRSHALQCVKIHNKRHVFGPAASRLFEVLVDTFQLSGSRKICISFGNLQDENGKTKSWRNTCFCCCCLFINSTQPPSPECI